MGEEAPGAQSVALGTWSFSKLWVEKPGGVKGYGWYCFGDGVRTQGLCMLYPPALQVDAEALCMYVEHWGVGVRGLV